jgi:hypothetical protein
MEFFKRLNYKIMATRKNYLSASFRDLERAEKAYGILRDRGYHDNEITVLMSEDSVKKYFHKDPEKEKSDFGNKAAEGAGVGAGVGGAIGAAAGIILALGTAVAVPGLGIVVAGPLAAGLAGAGGGGITGGIIGALVGAGIPKETADKYEQGVKEGEIVIAVELRNDEDRKYFEGEWRRQDVYPKGKTITTTSEGKARAGASEARKSKSASSKNKNTQTRASSSKTTESKSGTTKNQTTQKSGGRPRKTDNR